jgi:hypothetical protein
VQLPTCGAALVKPLVTRVVFGEDDDEDFHFTQGAVAGAWANEDRDTRAHGDDVLIELHAGVGAALEEIIRFSETLVIVQAGVCGDVGDVDRGGEVGNIFERTMRGAAGALDAGDGGEIDKFVGFGGHVFEPREARRHGANTFMRKSGTGKAGMFQSDGVGGLRFYKESHGEAGEEGGKFVGAGG